MKTVVLYEILKINNTAELESINLLAQKTERPLQTENWDELINVVEFLSFYKACEDITFKNCSFLSEKWMFLHDGESPYIYAPNSLKLSEKLHVSGKWYILRH